MVSMVSSSRGTRYVKVWLSCELTQLCSKRLLQDIFEVKFDLKKVSSYNTYMSKKEIDPRNIGRPNLPLEEVLENEALANMAPDSTRDNGPRPRTWNPPLVSKEEFKIENPYSK